MIQSCIAVLSHESWATSLRSMTLDAADAAGREVPPHLVGAFKNTILVPGMIYRTYSYKYTENIAFEQYHTTTKKTCNSPAAEKNTTRGHVSRAL